MSNPEEQGPVISEDGVTDLGEATPEEVDQNVIDEAVCGSQPAVENEASGIVIPESGPVRPADVDEFDTLVALLRDPDVPLHKKTVSIKRIRMSLSREDNPPIKELLNIDGCLETLVECLQDSRDRNMQFESAWAITNIASGTSEDTKAVVNSGAVKVFSKFILDTKGNPESCNEDIVEQAVWAIGNIVGDGATFRNIVLEGEPELLQALVDMCSYQRLKTSVRNNITWTISNFLRGKPVPPREVVIAALPLLVGNVMTPPNDDILMDTLWALSYYTDGEDSRISDVLDGYPDVLPKLCEHLNSGSKGILTPALRTVGNIVTGTTDHTKQVLRAGVLPLIYDLMVPGSIRGGGNILKECCWLVSNITAESRDEIQQVIDGGFLVLLVHHVKNGRPQDRKEAIWALFNLATGGTNEQIAALLPFVKELMEVFGNIQHETIEFVSLIDILAENQNDKFFEILDRDDLLRLQSTVILRVDERGEDDDRKKWKSHCNKVGQVMEKYEQYQMQKATGHREP